MPRPRRAQGRPGTRAIPAAWARDHAPVVEGTFSATVVIFDPATGYAPKLLADFTYEPGEDEDPIYTGGARIQVVMTGQVGPDLIGEQQVITATYLVVIDRNAEVPVGSRVLVTAADDPMLTDGRRLIVRRSALGSVRWERDLWCVDDATYQPPADDDE